MNERGSQARSFEFAKILQINRVELPPRSRAKRCETPERTERVDWDTTKIHKTLINTHPVNAQLHLEAASGAVRDDGLLEVVALVSIGDEIPG